MEPGTDVCRVSAWCFLHTHAIKYDCAYMQHIHVAHTHYIILTARFGVNITHHDFKRM